MINQLILAVLLTIAPITELRAGMPLAIAYALENGIWLIPIISMIILANILVIFAVFFFLDNFHKGCMSFGLYKRFYNAYLERLQKKVDKFERDFSAYGFAALMIFVAVPLPGTGAWTGTILAWLLGLERKKSIIAIGLGVIAAGIVVALATIGIISLL